MHCVFQPRSLPWTTMRKSSGLGCWEAEVRIQVHVLATWLMERGWCLPQARSTSKWSTTTSTSQKTRWWLSAKGSGTCWWRRPMRIGGRWGRKRAQRLFMCRLSTSGRFAGLSCPHRNPVWGPSPLFWIYARLPTKTSTDHNRKCPALGVRPRPPPRHHPLTATLRQLCPKTPIKISQARITARWWPNWCFCTTTTTTSSTASALRRQTRGPTPLHSEGETVRAEARRWTKPHLWVNRPGRCSERATTTPSLGMSWAAAPQSRWVKRSGQLFRLCLIWGVSLLIPFLFSFVRFRFKEPEHGAEQRCWDVWDSLYVIIALLFWFPIMFSDVLQIIHLQFTSEISD